MNTFIIVLSLINLSFLLVCIYALIRLTLEATKQENKITDLENRVTTLKEELENRKQEIEKQKKMIRLASGEV